MMTSKMAKGYFFKILILEAESRGLGPTAEGWGPWKTKTRLRCSRSQMFFKLGVLKNFVIFTGKYLCRSLFLIKLTPKTPKRLQHRCFLVNYAKFLRAPFLQNTSGGCFCCFEKFVNFLGKHQRRRLNAFVFLGNTTEYNKMFMSYQNWLIFWISILLE